MVRALLHDHVARLQRHFRFVGDLAFWDRLFGTHVPPEHAAQLRLGLSDGEQAILNRTVLQMTCCRSATPGSTRSCCASGDIFRSTPRQVPDTRRGAAIVANPQFAIPMNEELRRLRQMMKIKSTGRTRGNIDAAGTIKKRRQSLPSGWA
jgi:hypothetical protein